MFGTNYIISNNQQLQLLTAIGIALSLGDNTIINYLLFLKQPE